MFHHLSNLMESVLAGQDKDETAISAIDLAGPDETPYDACKAVAKGTLQKWGTLSSSVSLPSIQ